MLINRIQLLLLILVSAALFFPETAMASAFPNGSHGYESVLSTNPTNNDLDLLSRLIQAEAASEPYQAKVAVGAVVLNRVQSSLFPDTINKVINQVNQGTYQFTPVFNGSINQPADADSVRAAKESLSGADPTVGALFFFNSDVTDQHLRSRTVSKVIGRLTFAF